MPLLGAHMSMAGGYYKAVDAAAACDMNVVQLFTKNNNQWRAKEISDDDVARFADALKTHKIKHPLSHSSYLINLGSPKDDLFKKSVDAMVVELQRAERLGIPWVVMHPGSYTTSSEGLGLKRIVSGIDEVMKQTKGLDSGILLENTAGQGSNLGWQFEHLAYLLDHAQETTRLGVCIDTCHAFAAGYAMGTEKEYRETMRQLNKLVSIKRVKAVHLNDSKREFGSRVDRHEHIGRGHLGLEPFRFLLNDRRWKPKPMYLETPKGTEDGEDLDLINLRTLRELIEG